MFSLRQEFQLLQPFSWFQSVLGVYEVVVRAVPTIKNYSVVSWLITALKLVSDKLNAAKNPQNPATKTLKHKV